MTVMLLMPAFMGVAATSHDDVQLKKRGSKLIPADDSDLVLVNFLVLVILDLGPDRYFSPRHGMPINSLNDGSRCVN
jgi:hypothetical protein